LVGGEGPVVKGGVEIGSRLIEILITDSNLKSLIVVSEVLKVSSGCKTGHIIPPGDVCERVAAVRSKRLNSGARGDLIAEADVNISVVEVVYD